MLKKWDVVTRPQEDGTTGFYIQKGLLCMAHRPGIGIRKRLIYCPCQNAQGSKTSPLPALLGIALSRTCPLKTLPPPPRVSERPSCPSISRSIFRFLEPRPPWRLRCLILKYFSYIFELQTHGVANILALFSGSRYFRA